MNPIEFYNTQLKKHQNDLKSIQKKLLTLSMLRLIVFVLVVFGIYLSYSNYQLLFTVLLVGIVLFVFLLSKYTDAKHQRDLSKALADINEEELKIASGDFHHREKGLEYQHPTHLYSLDIDLFGRGSFFQFMNRTRIKEATQLLAYTLTANNTQNIPQRQEAIKELASKPEWRQQYSATASLIQTETPTLKTINWLRSHKAFLPKWIKFIPIVFSLVSIVLFGLVAFSDLQPKYLAYWLLIGLGISSIYLKKINQLAFHTSKVKDTFKQYTSLLLLIENDTFTSELLQNQQQNTQSDHKKASEIFAQFSKQLDALDNRNNMISAIFGNGLFLTDIKNAYKIEQWIAQYHTKASDWFEVVTFFDAYNSLGNFAFNHPEYVFPTINNQHVIDAKQLGHPLLKKDKRVDNDIQINNEQFFIITGANMAGKSTFLRTVSLHIVMANTGLPVCAASSTYHPVKLITSMRTSDSLTDESSYFFSELTRLKLIVDAIQKEPYFIILDEILKGTNSTDKAIGSRKFVEKLVASKATGIIATHDLSLCDIETELPQVKNYYFDAEIINDELHFDYQFKTGVCKNMNASFLLKKMEIV
jgi:ABC-type multidrug transport system fused ATPase/permease subunit